MFDLWAVAVLVFSSGAGVAAVGFVRESQIVSRHKKELDELHAKLRAAEADIRELKVQVRTLIKFVGPHFQFSAGGDFTLGGDAVGQNKGEG